MSARAPHVPQCPQPYNSLSLKGQKMTHEISKIFCAPSNMAEVINIIEGDTSLSETARRDIVSSIRRMATMLDCDPRDLHAHVGDLRRKLMLIHPATFGITTKSLANIKANVARGLVIAGIIPVGPKPKERSPAWVEFLGHATAKHQAFALSRFVLRRGLSKFASRSKFHALGLRNQNAAAC